MPGIVPPPGRRAVVGAGRVRTELWASATLDGGPVASADTQQVLDLAAKLFTGRDGAPLADLEVALRTARVVLDGQLPPKG